MTYSITYYPKPLSEECAVDWNWHYKGWARSELINDYYRSWEPIEGLDRNAHFALLEHFGLREKASEFPLEKIVNMSPAEIARLSGNNPESNCIGDNRKASEVN